MSHASNMARHARRGAKEVRGTARHLKNVAKAERNGVMHSFQKVGNEAVNVVKEGYEGLRDTAVDYVDQGCEQIESVELSLEKQFKQRPLAAVLMAAGFGFLAGFLYSRR